MSNYPSDFFRPEVETGVYKGSGECGKAWVAECLVLKVIL